VLLLAAFFVALASAGKPGAWAWLTYFPPFTPFLLLVKSPESVTLISQIPLLGTSVMASVGMSLLAARLLSVAPHTFNIFRGNSRSPQSLV